MLNLNQNKEVFAEIESLLITYSQKINPIIEELLLLNVKKDFQKMILYQMKAGGKRLRPVLAILVCRALGGKEKDVLYPAAGLEIIHNYSLIVDDIIDHSLFRRNLPTVWVKFGISMADCVAIDFAASIFQAANQSIKAKVIVEVFAKVMKEIVDGEIMDILMERSGREKEPFVVQKKPKIVNRAMYFEMIAKKTASLFSACCETGALTADISPKIVRASRDFGYNLGLAFQMQDDILDMFGNQDIFGKKIGKDIQERKGGSIALILALENLPKVERDKISWIFQKKKITDGDVAAVLKLIRNTDALSQAEKLKNEFILKAQKCLVIFPQNRWTSLLRELPIFVAQRNK